MRAPRPIGLAGALLLAGVAPAQRGWDVPHRGALVYDRTEQAFDVAPPPSQVRAEPLIAGADAGGHEWRYFACPTKGVPPGFEQPGFDDAGWLLGRGEFGTEVDTQPAQRTRWQSQALCLRTVVQMPRKAKAIVLEVNHDDGIRVWLNGTLVVSNDGYGRNRRYVVAGDALDAITRGPNLVAVQCTNVGGAQYFDLAMAALPVLPAGARGAGDLEAALREAAEAAGRVRRELFGAYRTPGLVLQGELDETQRSVRIPPADLRDVGWFVATDLRAAGSGGSVSLDATRMFRLGDLEIRGRAGIADGEGWQTIETTVQSTRDQALRGDTKRYVERHVLPHVLYGFDGTLRVRRRLETRAGGTRVTEFTTELAGTFLRGKDRREEAATLRHEESWRLAAVRDNQDAGFRAMVQQALEKGLQRLREQLKDPATGDTAAQPPDADRSYGSGRLALGLLALVKGGLPADDEVVQRGFEALRKRTLIDTYSLGNALMAMEAMYAPKSEIGDLKAGAIDRPRKRDVPAEDLALMQRWTDRLLENVDARVDPAFLLRFHYVGGGDFDNSVNQYGLLGLYSAHLCGVELPATTWEAAANHLLASQSPEGPRVSFELVDYRTHARRQTHPEEQSTGSKISGRALGWSYKEPKAASVLAPTWGSMTCAGITGLAIVQGALEEQPGLRRARLLQDVTRARHDGFAWLAERMTVRHHAGAIERQPRWFYYYLYSLERAALLSGIALIADRDWYFEGATVLALAQRDNGEWPGELLPEGGIETNAMAILFLKQSTLPVLTGR